MRRLNSKKFWEMLYIVVSPLGPLYDGKATYFLANTPKTNT